MTLAEEVIRDASARAARGERLARAQAEHNTEHSFAQRAWAKHSDAELTGFAENATQKANEIAGELTRLNDGGSLSMTEALRGASATSTQVLLHELDVNLTASLARDPVEVLAQLRAAEGTGDWKLLLALDAAPSALADKAGELLKSMIPKDLKAMRRSLRTAGLNPSLVANAELKREEARELLRAIYAGADSIVRHDPRFKAKHLRSQDWVAGAIATLRQAIDD